MCVCVRVCVCVCVRARSIMCVLVRRIPAYNACSIKVRGHNLVWSVDQFIQDWVKQLWGNDLRNAVKAHITETMQKTQGL